ncbi:MAG: ribosome biogenesis GTPase YlqF, partial [Clostridia bacterium]|nr:ribosome biogenesis GTPase YlqF [Clostridia bacterium]
MAKTRRLITENLSLVDLVIEVVDARIPASSRNPEITRLTASKPRLTVLTKVTLADPAVSDKWRAHFAATGEHCLFCDCISGAGLNQIPAAVREILSEKLERYDAKGMTRDLKAMVVGIPNVGKS